MSAFRTRPDETAAIISAIDRCLSEKESTISLVARCFRSSTASSYSGLQQLADLAPTFAQALGLPVWLFGTLDEIYELFDHNGDGRLDEAEVKRLVWFCSRRGVNWEVEKQ